MEGNGRMVVIGVGELGRRDDGFGSVVISLLRDRGLLDVEYVETSGDLRELIFAWSGARLAIVVDTMRSRPLRPGRVHRLSAHHPAAQHALAATGERTPGLPNLGETVQLAQHLDRLPRRLLLFVVEAGDLASGRGLSPEVADAAVAVADEIAELLTAEAGAARAA